MPISALIGDMLEQLLAMVVLLHLLNDTPQVPSDNPFDDSSIPSDTFSTRVLSLKREKELAETLAFLAAYTADPKKVVALCIEEEDHGKAMTIRMAVNNGGLLKLQEGFQTVAGILERIAKRESIAPEIDEADLLREVVSLNHNRILCRLRSKHATLNCRFKERTKLKPKVLSQLQATVAKIPGTGMSAVSSTVLLSLRSDVQKLHSLFESLEAMATDEALSRVGLDVLLEIVVVARQLCSKNILELVLKSSALGNDSQMCMARCIMKLARYSTASTFLMRAANKFSVFASIRVLIVKLPPPPIKSITSPESLQATITCSMFGPDEVETAVASLRARLQKKCPQSPDIENTIAGITSTKFVVHAEIQLLIYYELNSSEPPPRVICSSKKACFLCNLFIRLHGKFIIPSTHGRLYEKWTFPESIESLPIDRAEKLGEVINRLSDFIKTELRIEILKARKPHPAPYESIMFASTVWTPPNQSRSRLESPSATSYNYLQQTQARTHMDSSSGLNDLPKDSAIVFPPITSNAHSFRVPEQPVHNIKAPQRPPKAYPSEYLPLTRGEILVFDMTTYGDVLKVGTPRIHLALCYEGLDGIKSTLECSGTPDLTFRRRISIEWLQICNTVKPGDVTFVDLAKFPKGSEMTLNQFAGNCNFYVTHGSDMISIQTL